MRTILCGAGFYEAWTTTFVAPEDLARAGDGAAAVEVENPLDRSQSLLRPSLLAGLLGALRFNLDRQLDTLALFEIGRVFGPPGPDEVPQLPREEEHLAVAVLPPPGAGPLAAVESVVNAWKWLAEGLRLERPGVVGAERPGLHPGRSAALTLDGTEVGHLGEVDPAVSQGFGLAGRVGWMTLSVDQVARARRRPLLSVETSRYPASDLDLAFVVPDDVPASAVASALSDCAAGLLEDLALFDVFRGPRLGPGVRSLAFRIRLRAREGTLREEELARLRRALIDAARRCGATLRS